MIFTKLWFWVLLVVVIGILIFVGYRWYLFNECKKKEGEVCGTKIGFRTTGGTTPINVPVSKRVKCNFWTGKICE